MVYGGQQDSASGNAFVHCLSCRRLLARSRVSNCTFPESTTPNPDLHLPIYFYIPGGGIIYEDGSLTAMPLLRFTQPRK